MDTRKQERKASEAKELKKPENRLIAKPVKGVLCIIASAFCFSLMSLFVRLSGDVPVIQKCFFRNAVALIIAAIWGMLFLEQLPDKFSIMGYVIIIGTAVAKWYHSIHKPARAEQSL